MTSTIENFIVRHLADIRGLEVVDIERDADLFEHGYIDSLGVFNLMMLLEDTFDVRLGEDELIDPKINTVAGLAAVIAHKRGCENV